MPCPESHSFQARVRFKCLTLVLGSFGTPDVYPGCALGTHFIDETRVAQQFPQSWWQSQDLNAETFASQTFTFNYSAVLPLPVTLCTGPPTHPCVGSDISFQSSLLSSSQALYCHALSSALLLRALSGVPGPVMGFKISPAFLMLLKAHAAN